MSNVQSAKQDLDNLARLQQMKINTRLTALQAAQTLMGTVGFYREGPTSNVDHVTLLAIASDVESYILGDIEAETKKAMDAAAVKMNSPRLLRP